MVDSSFILAKMNIDLVQIPSGSFIMGSPSRENPWEHPAHQVTLKGFLVGRTPITQAQWREVASWAEGPGERWERALKPDPSEFEGNDRPVESVSWFEAMEFCSRLSQRTGCHYTLPSEAQWEYACKAGTTTTFHFGDTITTDLANYDGTRDCPKGKYRKQTTPVGMFPANAWGLHDMHGNVWEWCLDNWHSSYDEAPTDGSAWLGYDTLGRSYAAVLGSLSLGTAARPTAAASAPSMPSSTSASEWSGFHDTTQAYSIVRGGSWYDYPVHCRSAYRGLYHPAYANDLIGFRVCCLP